MWTNFEVEALLVIVADMAAFGGLCGVLVAWGVGFSAHALRLLMDRRRSLRRAVRLLEAREAWERDNRASGWGAV